VISAIIVNHNGRHLLRRCLESLGASTVEVEVLLVDNASSDDSLALVRERFPDVRVLEQARNLGFGAANNIAATAARGDTLLLLNADAWLEEGALDFLAARLAGHPRNGLAAPRLLYPDGRRQFAWSPERGAFGEALQQLRNRHESSAWAHGPIARLLARVAGRPWYTAACVLLRSEAFREVGGFDERFFMYFEDVDLCVRLEAAGWRLVQEPRAVARHEGGFARHPKVDDLYRPSQLRYYATHRPAWELRLVERRLRRRYGDREVERWLAAGDEGP
jgi:GT2 family glycosyltransferase